LNALRSADVVIPDEFSSIMTQQSYLLRWLLNHDPAKRPTSLELLQSDYLPPPQVNLFCDNF
jgi:translation initiation factor 2-alpha kinase 4